jgi:hypothetical protein
MHRNMAHLTTFPHNGLMVSMNTFLIEVKQVTRLEPTRSARALCCLCLVRRDSMRRLVSVSFLLILAACGGGKSANTLSVTCSTGTQLVGAESIDVLGDLANGQPKMEFPDPANAGQTGSILVQPHNHCKITPGAT